MTFLQSLERVKSRKIFERSQEVLPGGVNSPVRAFKGMPISALVVEEGKGDEIFDVDQNSYIDYCASWGALILGHAHPYVVDKAQKQLAKGSTFGIATPSEEKLARKITKLLPHIEKIRFVSSGTEATMTAVRLARSFTGKNIIIKFEGHYHGHADHFLVKGGSGLIESTQTATSAGVPFEVIKNTLTLPFNDISALRETLESLDNIAAIILEPIAANMGVVLPDLSFLTELKTLCQKYGILLIFDEVITGFRIGLQGASALFNIYADLYCFGKIIGGGFPCAAFGGRRDIMDLLAPLGPVYQAGTLSGNPVAMEAGYATLEILEEPNFYKNLEEKAAFLLDPIAHFIKNRRMNLSLERVGSMFTLFFGSTSITKFQRYNLEQFRAFFCFLFERGIYFAPSQYEANFISSAHTMEHLAYTRDQILEFLDK
jgi:glutamate-1-semialdehyde 2,1-aminomutase